MFKGLYRDSDPQNQPEGTYRDAENVSLSRIKGSISQEESFLEVDSLPDGFTILGHAILTTGDIVLFLCDRYNISSRIGKFNGVVYSDLFVDSSGNRLGFNTANPIQTVSKTTSDGKEVVYWVDGKNPIRYFEIPDTQVSPNISEFELFPKISKSPIILDVELETGGILKTGTYYVAVALEDDRGNRTNYVYISNPISIPSSSQGELKGAINDSGSGYGLNVDLSYIDTKYTYFRLALIKGTQVQLLPKRSTQSISNIFINGSETYIPGSLDEIIVDRNYYNTANAISDFGGSLYLGNIKEPERISYQPWANAIKIHVTKENVPVAEISGETVNDIPVYKGHDNDYRTVKTQTQLKGFKRGEVYAFYISLVYKDGSESPAYHIPGRQAVSDDRTDNFEDGAAAAAIGAQYKFQLEPEPDAETGMGFWENQDEVYPDTGDFDVKDVSGNVIDTLRNQKVRHHHIPFDDNEENQLYRGTDAGPNAKVVGIQLKNVKFPQSILSEIVAYKVYYAKRNLGNSKWFDQGFIDRCTTNSSQNELGEPTYHIARHETGTFTPKYLAMIPFHSMRTKQNVGILDGAYIKRNTSSDFVQNGVGTTLAQNRTPKNYDSVGLGLSPNPHPYRAINWAGYVDRDSITIIGNDSDKFYNKGGTEMLILEVDNFWQWNWDIVDIFKFRTSVYNSFYEQQLVFTGYTNNILISSVSDGIWGGDVFVNYEATLMMVPTGTGSSIDDSDSLVVLHQGVYESVDNIGLRHEGSESYQVFFPEGLLSEMQSNNDLQGLVSNSEDAFEFIRNYIGYNEEYSKQNDLKPAFPYNPYLLYNTDLSNRIVRSEKDNAETLEDNYRIFKDNDYADIPKNRGDIVKLVSLNSAMLIHCKSGFFRTYGREELEVEDFRAFVGQGDILARDPQEIISVPEGFGGIESPFHSINTKLGYLFVSTKAKKIYLLSDRINEISSKGMESFFKDNIFYNTKLTNPSRVRLGYDPNHNRLFIYNNNWQLSYIPSLEAWESFHSGKPEYYIWNERDLFALNTDSVIYKKDNLLQLQGSYFGSYEDMKFTSIFNGDRELNKLVHGIIIDSLVLDKDTNTEINNKTIDSVKVFSQNQETDELEITTFSSTTFPSNARRRNREWLINNIRANDTIPSHFPDWKKQRLTGKFIGITIKYLNPGNEVIVIHKILPRYQNTIV